MKQAIHAQNAPAALGPYHHAIAVNGFLFTSGQLGLDPVSGVLPATIEEQTTIALANLEQVLIAGGSSLSNMVKTTIFLQDLNDFNTVNQIYADKLGTEFPARSCVQVAKLPKGALIEIEAIAVIPQ